MTRADLLADEVPATQIRSWLRTGRAHKVFDGVYAWGHPSLTREERWLAAVMACGPGAALSHLSAALLWAIIKAQGRYIDVSVPRTREGIAGIQVHRRRHPPNTTTQRGIPTTTIAQTLLDLAAQFSAKALETALGEAQLQREFDADDLESLIATSRRRGVTKLRDL